MDRDGVLLDRSVVRGMLDRTYWGWGFLVGVSGCTEDRLIRGSCSDGAEYLSGVGGRHGLSGVGWKR